MITLTGVTKSYQSQRQTRAAVSDVSLTVESGQMLAVVGPNGAGKSSLLGLISGLLSPDSGTIEGSPTCSVVLQQTSLDQLLTVRENALLFARVYSVEKALRETRVQELAELTGLQDRLDDRVSTLSGGLARRADLLRAAMVGPELLILDEPTSGLDRDVAPEIIQLVTRFKQEHGMGVVLVTHNLEEAEAADRVVMLQDGAVVMQGSPEELLGSVGTGIVFSLNESASGVLDDRQPGIMRLSPHTFVVQQDHHEHVVQKLLEMGEPYSVRSLRLADVYDRVMGSEA